MKVFAYNWATVDSSFDHEDGGIDRLRSLADARFQGIMTGYNPVAVSEIKKRAVAAYPIEIFLDAQSTEWSELGEMETGRRDHLLKVDGEPYLLLTIRVQELEDVSAAVKAEEDALLRHEELSESDNERINTRLDPGMLPEVDHGDWVEANFNATVGDGAKDDDPLFVVTCMWVKSLTMSVHAWSSDEAREVAQERSIENPDHADINWQESIGHWVVTPIKG